VRFEVFGGELDGAAGCVERCACLPFEEAHHGDETPRLDAPGLELEGLVEHLARLGRPGPCQDAALGQVGVEARGIQSSRLLVVEQGLPGLTIRPRAPRPTGS